MSRKKAQFPTVAQRDARRSQTNPRMTSSSSKNAWRNYDPKTFASERSRVSREEHIESVGQDYMGDLLEKYKRTPRGGAGGGRRENTQTSEPERTPRQKRRAVAEKTKTTTTTPRQEQWAELARAQRAERERQEAERQRQLERQEAERQRKLEAEQVEKDRRKLARELERLPTIDKLKTPRVQVQEIARVCVTSSSRQSQPRRVKNGLVRLPFIYLVTSVA